MNADPVSAEMERVRAEALRWLADPEEAKRLRGVHLLRDHHAQLPDAVELLVETMGGPGRYVPHAARTVLQDLGEVALPRLLVGLEDAREAVRLGSIWALARDQGDRVGEVLAALRTRVSEPSRELRHAVAGAIGRVGADPDVTLRELEPLLADREARVRTEAAESIGLSQATARRASDRLLDLLDDGDSQVRVAVARALAAVEPGRAAWERLSEALDEEVDEAARLSLLSLRDDWAARHGAPGGDR